MPPRIPIDVYDRLLGTARSMLRHHGPPDLHPIDLVHEAYLRLARRPCGIDLEEAGTRAMHGVLVDDLRKRASLKRGGRHRRIRLDGVAVARPATIETDTRSLAAALEVMARESRRGYEIVRLRHVAGLTERQTAAALGISERTVRRETRAVRRHLRDLVSRNGTGSANPSRAGAIPACLS